MTSQTFQHRACPACGTRDPLDEIWSQPRAEALSFEDLRPHWSGLFKDKIFFSYARCSACKLLYAPRYFTDDQLGNLYADMAPNMEDVPGDALAATQRDYWHTAKAAGLTAGGYLEIGPDIGYIVERAAREGSFDQFWLYEPNVAVHAQLAAAALEKPHHISTAMHDLSAVPERSIALAVMVHVLDHLLDPMATLKAVREKMKPDGMVLIVTHNEDSLLRRATSVRWPPFCLQHPELYNPDSITQIAQRAGFNQVDVARAKNYFPIAFLARQACHAVGFKVGKLPLPESSIGLKLGNIVTIARP
jgi:2-polyprenyl-3-methyl-5-hydroxy-6-metoxy-1,4-benzoquinol methylase